MNRGLNKIYRIWNKLTNSYIRVGYNQKTSWSSFPSAVIKCNPQVFSKKSDFEVHEFETSPSRKLSITKEEI